MCPFESMTDPDPSDTMTTTEYVFITREHDGTVTSHGETHQYGLFPRRTWVRLLQQQVYPFVLEGYAFWCPSGSRSEDDRREVACALSRYEGCRNLQ